MKMKAIMSAVAMTMAIGGGSTSVMAGEEAVVETAGIAPVVRGYPYRGFYGHPGVRGFYFPTIDRSLKYKADENKLVLKIRAAWCIGDDRQTTTYKYVRFLPALAWVAKEPKVEVEAGACT